MTEIAKLDDLDRQFCIDAHRWNSFDAEKRADAYRQEYVEDVNGLNAQLAGQCTTDEQRAILATEMERYRQGYLDRYRAMLSARLRTASPMVTGPSNFPTARNRKRLDTEQRRIDEFLEWRRRARMAVARKIADARPETTKREAEWKALKRDIDGSLATINGIDNGDPEWQGWTRSSFVNSIVGKVKRLAERGEIDLVNLALAHVRDYNERHVKPAITDRHEFWKYGQIVQDRVTALDAEGAREPETVLVVYGISVVKNYQIDRVQIVFDDKPDSVTRERLKTSGWHWSPRELAWQRKLTEAAVSDAMRIVGAEGQ